MNTPRPLRIVFILTKFTVGGAEMMLWKLISRMDRGRFDPYVVALSSAPDGMAERFVALGVPCEVLGMSRGLGAFAPLGRLAVLLRSWKPDIVQGWLYHGNLAATVAAALARLKVPVLWNIRGTLPSPAEKNWRSAALIRLSGALSSLPSRIINNSSSGAAEHEASLRYPGATRVVLPNGFDTERFRPSPDARRGIRSELHLPAEAVLVGLCARYHAMKDHANFVRAAAIVSGIHPDVHFLLAGEHVNEANPELERGIREAGLCARAHMLGRRDDMERVTAALDVACSTSAYGEGFPNVIGEAMSCAVPCVVTDVGDSARIVADTGRVVPPWDPQAFARALCDLVEQDPDARRELGLRARKRIVDYFSLDSVVRLYEALYQEVHEQRLESGSGSVAHSPSASER